MSHLRIQGQIFIGISLFVALSSLAFGPLSGDTELWLVAGLILLLGVPHGALDLIYANDIVRPRNAVGWAGFGAAYLLIAAAVVCLWKVEPGFFLAVFLIISCLHFSADPISGTAIVVRCIYGGAIVVLPSLQYGQEVRTIFAMLIGESSAAAVQQALAVLVWPWLISLAVVIPWLWRSDRWSAIEVCAVALLVAALPPLLAFTIYFCGMHSPRHVLRTGAYFKHTAKALLMTAAPAMLGVFMLIGLLWSRLPGMTGSTALGVNVVTLIFVGLAALTVPHMLLVERVRFTAPSSIW